MISSKKTTLHIAGTTKTTFVLYWRATKRYKWQLVLSLAILPIGALASPIAIPYFISQIVADLIDFSNGNEDVRNLIVHHVTIVGLLLLVDLAVWRRIRI